MMRWIDRITPRQAIMIMSVGAFVVFILCMIAGLSSMGIIR